MAPAAEVSASIVATAVVSGVPAAPMAPPASMVSRSPVTTPAASVMAPAALIVMSSADVIVPTLMSPAVVSSSTSSSPLAPTSPATSRCTVSVPPADMSTVPSLLVTLVTVNAPVLSSVIVPAALVVALAVLTAVSRSTAPAAVALNVSATTASPVPPA